MFFLKTSNFWLLYASRISLFGARLGADTGRTRHAAEFKVLRGAGILAQPEPQVVRGLDWRANAVANGNRNFRPERLGKKADKTRVRKIIQGNQILWLQNSNVLSLVAL